MGTAVITAEGELTDEGRRMWENIANLEKLAAGESLLPPEKRKKIRFNMFEIELVFVRTEIRRMIKNSETVIKECEEIVKSLKTKEAYLSSEAKVAKRIHENLIERLKRVLDSMPAFDKDIFVEDEPRRPYQKS